MRLLSVLFSGFVFCTQAAPDASTAGMNPRPWPQMPYVYMPPEPQHGDEVRMFQGIPAVAAAPNGRLWVAWYGGGECEGPDNYVMLATSGDGGATWSAPGMVIDPPFRASEPALWLDPGGRLWFMWNLYPLRPSRWQREEYAKQYSDIAVYNAHIREFNTVAQQLWGMTADRPGDQDPEWSEPRLIAMETHNMNKPIVLSDGTWLWPAAPLSPMAYRYPRSTRPLFSSDNGEKFFFRGEIPMKTEDRDVEEYQVVERRDGSLWMLTRTKYGIGESFSFDRGENWTEVRASGIKHTNSRFFITRLRSGKLLLVKNGRIDEDCGRSRMMAFLSDDDGETWSEGLLLDERKTTTYPDGVQAEDGTIHVVYDYGRREQNEILMAVFKEEDVVAGKAVSGECRFKVLVNKATGTNPRYADVPPRDSNLDGEPFRKELPGSFAVAGAAPVPFVCGEKIFSDRSHTVAESADLLNGAFLLQLPIDGTKKVTCSRAGTVYLLTPRPSRNRDSQSQSLFNQGFRKAAFREVLLFGDSTGAFCSLYQKDCAEGEVINVGKWAVPVFFP